MKERLSAWMDGEFEDAESASLLGAVKRDPALRDNWDCYHLIGDALRGVQGPDLCAKVRARLAAEPTVVAPQRRNRAERLRWYALSAAASVAAVIFVGWMALPGVQSEAVQTASVPSIQAVNGPLAEVKPVALPVDERAKDYLLAHQRYSPSNAMQGVAPYVRTVADERSVSLR